MRALNQLMVLPATETTVPLTDKTQGIMTTANPETETTQVTMEQIQEMEKIQKTEQETMEQIQEETETMKDRMNRIWGLQQNFLTART